MRIPRNLRFQIPAFFFLASLFWGLLTDPIVPVRLSLGTIFAGGGAGPAMFLIALLVIAIGAGGGFIALTEGYARSCMEAFTARSYRPSISPRALAGMSRALGRPIHPDGRHLAFEAWLHGPLRRESPGMQRWFHGRDAEVQLVMRCVAALMLSLAVEFALMALAIKSGIHREYGYEIRPVAWILRCGALWVLPMIVFVTHLEGLARSSANQATAMIDLLLGAEGEPEPKVAETKQPTRQPPAKKAPAKRPAAAGAAPKKKSPRK